MRHNDHCFHCGEFFPVAQDVCPNHECQTKETKIPVWPWSTCRENDCQVRAYSVLSWLQLFRQCGVGLLGVTLLLIGVLVFSNGLQLLGGILTVSWILLQSLSQNLRQTRSDIIVHEQKRREVERKFAEGEIEDTAQNRKDKKDISDDIRGFEWSCFGKNLLYVSVILFSAFMFLLVFLMYTTGGVDENRPSVGEITKGVEAKVEKAVSTVTEEVKEELDWTKGQIDYIYHELTENRSFTWDQFRVVEKRIKNNKVSAGKVIETLQETNIRGEGLYSKLIAQKTVSKVQQQQERHDKNTEAKTESAPQGIWNYTSGLWSEVWYVLLALEVLLGILLIVLVMYGILSFFVAWVYATKDEAKDQIKAAFESVMEKKGLTAVPKTSRETQEQSDSSEGGNSIWHSVLGSAIAESAAIVIGRFGTK